LRFDIPSTVEFICRQITIIGPQVVEELTKPWTSKRETFVELDWNCIDNVGVMRIILSLCSIEEFTSYRISENKLRG